jgi:hypothetical protein
MGCCIFGVKAAKSIKREGNKMITIRWYDRTQGKVIQHSIDADCVDIKLPGQVFQSGTNPEVVVVVNTDAVQVMMGGTRMGMLEYSDLVDAGN